MSQIDPMEFFGLLKWIDGRPLLDVMEPYRQKILSEALYTFRPDESPLFRRILTGRAKKNFKTCDAVLAALYKCLVWKPAGSKLNEVYFVASDLGQANDDLQLCKLLIRRNGLLSSELILKTNVIERRDGKGFIEILPARDAQGLHGKTYLFLVVDELHTQKTYDLLMALEIDRTRPDAVQWFASYASLYRHKGIPLVDLLAQHEAKSDPRLYVSWYAGSIEEANPSLNSVCGPTLADIEDAQRSLPSWVFRRLYLNQAGMPDGAAFDYESVEACIVKDRTVLPPEAGKSYVAFCDLSGGGADDATLAIAHDENGRVVLDCLIDQGPRVNRTFSPEATVERFSAILRQYNLREVQGDRYAAMWPILAFQKYGVHYRPADLNRSQIYSAFEPLLNSGRVELLDHPKLLQQFVGLVRKGEKIDHASGEHDDHCNSVAGACVRAVQTESQQPWAFNFISGEILEEVESDETKLLRREAYLTGTPIESIRARWEPVP